MLAVSIIPGTDTIRMLPMHRTCLEVKCRDATFSDNYGNQFNRVGMCLNSDSVKVRVTLAVRLRIMTLLYVVVLILPWLLLQPRRE